MAQNFKASEFDDLFGVHSVKTCFAGAGYKEVNERLETALAHNSGIKYIVRGLDYSGLLLHKDWSSYEGYPDYLYDEDPLNDVSYVFNKEILINNTISTLN